MLSRTIRRDTGQERWKFSTALLERVKFGILIEAESEVMHRFGSGLRCELLRAFQLGLRCSDHQTVHSLEILDAKEIGKGINRAR
jgi:hypothetical protein